MNKGIKISDKVDFTVGVEVAIEKACFGFEFLKKVYLFETLTLAQKWLLIKTTLINPIQLFLNFSFLPLKIFLESILLFIF